MNGLSVCALRWMDVFLAWVLWEQEIPLSDTTEYKAGTIIGGRMNSERFSVKHSLANWLRAVSSYSRKLSLGEHSLKKKKKENPWPIHIRYVPTLNVLYVGSTCRSSDCDVLPVDSCRFGVISLHCQSSADQLSLHLLKNTFFPFYSPYLFAEKKKKRRNGKT